MDLHLLAALRLDALPHLQAAAMPTQPHAIAVYVLVAVAGWAIWKGNRSGTRPAPGPDEPAAGKGDDPDS